MSLEIPAGASRLLPDYDPRDPDAGPLPVARLLEDGDSADLAWLVRIVPEPQLAAWLERRGARQLSVRSRAFWELILGVTAGGADLETARQLWPL
ncbi:MAG TPA: hypothetical protein VMW27_21735 [Thermoanaerobaculia bacterium]|nr:hypothetical protein [Thermoanaerobaculia bacterium]